MTDTQLLLEIFKTFDGTIALGIAVWIITIANKRMDTMQAQYYEAAKTVLKQQHDENSSLMDLIRDLTEKKQAPPPLNFPNQAIEGQQSN